MFNYGSYLPMAEFEAVPGDYQLELQVLADASCLQKLHPRLVVEADEESYSLLLETLGLSPLPYLCIAAGVVMVSLRVFDRRRESRVTTGVAGEKHLGPVIYQPRVRRALQQKFGGMPAFGTVAALTMFVILVPVWISNSWRLPTHGLFVEVSAKEYLRATANRSVGPLIVSIEIRKHEVAYRLNGKAVPFVDLNSALKQELSRRADWVVFVEGDDNLPYQDVAQVIDMAHGLQARSVLLTPQMKKGH
jgi:biopolymer transport protein ExbD